MTPTRRSSGSTPSAVPATRAAPAPSTARAVPAARTAVALALAVALPACSTQPRPAPAPIPEPVPERAAPAPTDAAGFVSSVEAHLSEVAEQSSRASWVQANFITHDTEILAAQASERYLGARTAAAVEAAEYSDMPGLEPDVARKLDILRTGITTPAPLDSTRRAELTRIASYLESAYGKGEWCDPDTGECLTLDEMYPIMANSRDEERLREVWAGWRTISPPMKDEYARFAELMNEGARTLGFSDTGELWRSGYDMPPEAFAEEVERLWGQVEPLYEQLHCHVRAELRAEYGPSVVPEDGAIPAHLLGNMWAQEWANIYELVAPGAVNVGYDLTALLEAEDYDALDMVRTGEDFFTSLGFAPLPATFWERSLFTKPADRDVVCHASAWDIDDEDDLRIKMCIQVNAEDFRVVHHELGHNFYQRAYNRQPWLYRDGAHDGFHEAVGDAVALSITPEYLVRLGLLDRAPPPSPERDVGLLLRDALDKVAFLPFGKLVDQWRWGVFAGDITPDEYNAAWWELRERYQGVAAPVDRPADAFDPGAKYHIPGNTPYTRYFLAAILQFQFHRALCDAAGYDGPLHRCTVYGNEAAGRRLRDMLAMGRSQPWPDALEAMTGSREMDATAIVDYFRPLMAWLEEQNRGRTCGW